MKTSAATAALAERLFATIASGDASAVPDLFAEDEPVLGIGTDPAEWWSGRETLLKVLAAQVEELHAVGARVEMGEVSAYELGDLGWAAARPTFTFGGENGFAGRLTVVAAKSNDDWRIVHFHLSVGVGNDEVVGSELTT